MTKKHDIKKKYTIIIEVKKYTNYLLENENYSFRKGIKIDLEGKEYGEKNESNYKFLFS